MCMCECVCVYVCMCLCAIVCKCVCVCVLRVCCPGRDAPCVIMYAVCTLRMPSFFTLFLVSHLPRLRLHGNAPQLRRLKQPMRLHGNAPQLLRLKQPMPPRGSCKDGVSASPAHHQLHSHMSSLPLKKTPKPLSSLPCVGSTARNCRL